MYGDPQSNFTISSGLPALSRGASTYYTASIDHVGGIKAAYHVTCGTWATSHVATLQHSADDSSFTDEADTTYGNTVSVTFTEADDGVIYVNQPRRRYTRVKLVLGGTCVSSVSNIKGPLDYVAES